MTEFDISKVNIPELNTNYSNNMISNIQRDIEKNIRFVQETREDREVEELRRHNELVAAIKEAGEKGASIIIGDNANGVQIQQNTVDSVQEMSDSPKLDYDKISKILADICSYFEYPQFARTFGDNSENVKAIIQSTLEAVEKHEDEGMIKKSLKVIKDLAIGAAGSIIASGILGLLGMIPL